MLFSSIVFLFYFLPVVFLVYAIAPGKIKNLILVIASLFFYAWGEPKYVFLMLGTITLGYAFGLLIERMKIKGRNANAAFFISVACVLASLGFFKYTDFLISSVNATGLVSFQLKNIALPIGISFYSFQLISYLVDVYRGDKAQHNFIDLATYISFFPQLIAGPIVRYEDISFQLNSRKHTLSGISYGAKRFILGLSKKMLIANLLAEFCQVYYKSSEKTVAFIWAYAIAYSLQVYFDFSGYSDMAIGLGSIFGFTFPENFNYPFISKSVTEFWRRWHMTLGSWFRDYVYIPLGGNRKGVPRHLCNILIVWALTGLWHGASWNFVCWGLYYAVLLLIDKYAISPLYNKVCTARRNASNEQSPAVHKADIISVLLEGLKTVATIVATLIGFIIFDATNMKSCLATIGGLFGIGTSPLNGMSAIASTSAGNLSDIVSSSASSMATVGNSMAAGGVAEFTYYIRSYAIIFIIAILGATPLPKVIYRKLKGTAAGEYVFTVLEPVILAALLIVCTAFMVDGSFNPFLYFRF